MPKRSLLLSLAFLLAVNVAFAETAVPPAAHTFSAGADGRFLLDGKPFQVRAGEMHYPRIPRAYWRDRMRKLKAMGLNTLTTYVFWNVHEPTPGAYDFAGQNDLAEYLREAQQEGLYVILRPGPYVCAEWELGGLPAWLLKDHEILLRSSDERFMTPTRRWFARLGTVVKPLLLANGGPILAVQVENEYGAFPNDPAYMPQILAALKASDMGDGYLYTADGDSYFATGRLPGIPAAVNFGPGDAEKSFAALKAIQPNGPAMSGEYWDGWFDHWGEAHQTRPSAVQEAELKRMMDRNESFNLYMGAGGTSFGWMNGANSDGSDYMPDTTSYDYDVAIDEAGGLRPKYFAFHKLMHGDSLKQPPPTPLPVTYPVQPITESASLWQNLPRPIHSAHPLTMEDIGQAYGYILYKTSLPAGPGGELLLDALHDYAVIYLDQKEAGRLDRRLNQQKIALPAASGPRELAILVENSGRINYTAAIRGERKGITRQVTLAGRELTGWEVYPLPMDRTADIRFSNAPCVGPCFYRTSLDASKSAGGLRDTFLDTSTLTKGFLWINGQPLGRSWNIGPQGALYLPGPWLRPGANETIIFDLGGSGLPSLRTVNHPVQISSGP